MHVLRIAEGRHCLFVLLVADVPSPNAVPRGGNSEAGRHTMLVRGVGSV